MHITTICAKANITAGNIELTFSCISIDRIHIYLQSLLRPILEDCSSIWSSCTEVSARNIEEIYKRWATKMVENLKGESYPEQFCVIGIPIH